MHGPHMWAIISLVDGCMLIEVSINLNSCNILMKIIDICIKSMSQRNSGLFCKLCKSWACVYPKRLQVIEYRHCMKSPFYANLQIYVNIR